MKPNYTASNPERIADKCRECRFFLAQMEDHAHSHDVEKLLYCLSAFLSSFRSAYYRLIGVVHAVNGDTAWRRLKIQLESEADIEFLKDRTNLEVHGDGAIVWPRYYMSVERSMHYSNDKRWPRERFPSRFESHFKPRFGTNTVRAEIVSWQLQGNPKNLIELCFDTLARLEEIYRQELFRPS